MERVKAFKSFEQGCACLQDFGDSDSDFFADQKAVARATHFIEVLDIRNVQLSALRLSLTERGTIHISCDWGNDFSLSVSPGDNVLDVFLKGYHGSGGALYASSYGNYKKLEEAFLLMSRDQTQNNKSEAMGAVFLLIKDLEGPNSGQNPSAKLDPS